MKRKLILLGIVFFVVLLVSSCNSNAIPKKLPELFQKEKLINGRLGSFKIIDNRKDTSSTPIKVPAFLVKTKSYGVNPSLNYQQKELIEAQVRSYMVDSSNLNSFDVKIYLEQGEKRIDGTAISVSEHTVVDLKIELFNTINNSLIIGYGAVNYDFPMINATVKHLDLLFDITLKNALHMSLAKVKDGQKQ